MKRSLGLLSIPILFIIAGSSLFFAMQPLKKPLNTVPAAVNSDILPSPQPPAIAAAPGEAKAKAAEATLTAQFHVGNYGSALAIADQQLLDPDLSSEYKGWLKRQLPSLLTSYGWLLLQQGRCEDALTPLKRSLSLSENQETLKALAFCYFKLKQWSTAEDHLLKYLPKNPKDKDMLMMQAEILESEARPEEAASVLEQLVANTQNEDKDGQTLKQRLSSMNAKVKESEFQTTITSEHFSLFYRLDDHESITAETLATLEMALSEFTEEWGLNIPPEMIEVYLYPSQEFSSLVAYGPGWANGIFDGRIRIQMQKEFLLGKSAAYAKLLRHELVHALIAEKTDSRELPYWLNEGIAMFLECPAGCRDVEWPTVPGQFLKKEAFSGRFVDLPAGQAKIVYRQSLFLIQVLMRMRSGNGGNPVGQILKRLTRQSALDSDSLLLPIRLPFDALYKEAASSWQKRINP